MTTKEKIIRTLGAISDELREIAPEFSLIGASAMILSGYDIGETGDVDILTSSENADRLQKSLSKYREENPLTKEDELFRSNFARFQLPWMEVEVLGDLQIRKAGVWQDVKVTDYQELSIEGLTVRVPTVEEQIRILRLFGREKDMKRIAQLTIDN